MGGRCASLRGLRPDRVRRGESVAARRRLRKEARQSSCREIGSRAERKPHGALQLWLGRQDQRHRANSDQPRHDFDAGSAGGKKADGGRTHRRRFAGRSSANFPGSKSGRFTGRERECVSFSQRECNSRGKSEHNAQAYFRDRSQLRSPQPTGSGHQSAARTAWHPAGTALESGRVAAFCHDQGAG